MLQLVKCRAGIISAKGLLLFIWCNFDVIYLLQLSYQVIKIKILIL